MALIKCPECHKEISDKAMTCPNCAYPLNLHATNGQQINDTRAIDDCSLSADVLLIELEDAATVIKKLEDLRIEKDEIDHDMYIAKGEKFIMESMKPYLYFLTCPICSIFFAYIFGHIYNDKAAYFGLIFGIIIGIILAKSIDAMVFRTGRRERAEEYYKSKTDYMGDRLYVIAKTAQKLILSPEFKKAQSVIPNEYFDSESASYIYKLVANHRADSLKEAINMYEDYLHKTRIEEMQEAQMIAAQEAAIAQQQTAKAMEQQAGYSRQLAENSKTIAHYTRSTARATKLNTFINLVKK